MKYQKPINLLDDTTNQPPKLGTKSTVEINDELRGAYNDDDDNNNDEKNNNIKLKTSMIRSSLSDYSDAHMLVKGTITVPNMAAAGAAVSHTNKKILFKNCALFTSCITEINNTQVDNAEDIDIIMPVYNLIEYGTAYLKTSESL